MMMRQSQVKELKRHLKESSALLQSILLDLPTSEEDRCEQENPNHEEA